MMHPLDDASLGWCIPWMMHPYDDASLGRFVPSRTDDPSLSFFFFSVHNVPDFQGHFISFSGINGPSRKMGTYCHKMSRDKTS
jgi:hypothetical protein